MNAALGTISRGESWLGISTNAAVHFGVVCDASRMQPIVGMRYRRADEDYDLCGAEFDKLPEAERAKYVMIARPGSPPLPYSAAAALQLNQRLTSPETFAVNPSGAPVQPGAPEPSSALGSRGFLASRLLATEGPPSKAPSAAAPAYGAPTTQRPAREPAPRIVAGESWLGISGSAAGPPATDAPRGSRSFLAASMRASESEHKSFWGAVPPATPKPPAPLIAAPLTAAPPVAAPPLAAPLAASASASAADHLAATAARAEDQVNGALCFARSFMKAGLKRFGC
jgi:hypothetical protein